MNSLYKKLEALFEKLVEITIKIYGSPLTFIIALVLVIIFLTIRPAPQHLGDIIRDIILSVTFLSFFIIQKAVNKYTRAIHIKMNELVSAHDKASNEMMHIEEKSEKELKEIAETHKKDNPVQPQ